MPHGFARRPHVFYFVKHMKLDEARGAGKSMRKLYRSTATESIGARNKAIRQLHVFYFIPLVCNPLTCLVITAPVKSSTAVNAKSFVTSIVPVCVMFGVISI